MFVQNPSKAVNQNKCFFLFQCLDFPAVEKEEAVIVLWEGRSQEEGWNPLSPELPGVSW